MTLGYLLGISAAFFWSIVNLTDKYLVEKFCKESGVGALIVLSSLFPITLLPVSFFASNGNVALDPSLALLLVLSGTLTTLWISLYLYALEDDDVSTVMPLFQLTPVFALITAFIFLNELPQGSKLLAATIILGGSFVLSYERATGRFKWKLLCLIGGASLSIALMNTLFKFVAVDTPFWISMFWHIIGITITGTTLFLSHKSYRDDFISFLKENAGMGLGLNAFNESLTLIGDVLFAYATLLAPLALIQTTEAFQPIFVFLIGLFLTLTLPQVMHEDFSRNVIIQKALGIILIVFGTIILYSL